MRKIAVSIMCADQLHLADELKKLEVANVDLLHCDVMDGVYVNNLALGPEHLAAVKRATDIPLDIHLATITPGKYVEMYGFLSPEYISFHIETAENVEEIIQQIRSFGVKPALAINPETPVERLYPYLYKIDMVLMMTVNPGFAGQKFQTIALEKLAKLKAKLEELGLNDVLIEVDGNINSDTIELMNGAMPDIFVLGTSALFHERDNLDYEGRIAQLFRCQKELVTSLENEYV